MRASRILPIVAVAALSTVLFGAPAQADDEVAVLTTGSLGGANVAVGDVLTAPLVSGTTAFFANSSGGSTGVSCAASSFTATATDNPAAPGTATESTTGQTFASCTANIVGVMGVNSVTVNSLPMATTVDSAGGVTVASAAAPIQTTLSLRTLLGSISCVYRAKGSIAGVASNTDNSIAFANQMFAKASGSVLCPANGFFTAKYGPVVDTSVEGSPAVFVN